VWGVKPAVAIIATTLIVALAALPTQTPGGAIDGAVHVGYGSDIRAMERSGNTLWIGTSGGVVHFDLDSATFTRHATLGEVLPSNSVRAIRSKGDSVLVGTDAGLAIFDGDITHVFTNRNRGAYDSLSFDLIRSLDLGRGDAIFIGTYGDGLGVMTPDEGRAITREDSLLDDKVYGVVETWTRGPGDLEEVSHYYATSMGLCAYRDSAWVGFQAGAGIPRGEVRRIFARDGGGYYLLVGVGGVYRFNGARAIDVSPRDVLAGNDIADIAIGRRAVWAVGRSGGIAVYQNGSWRRIGQGDRLIDAARWRCVYAEGDDAYFGSADGLLVTVRDNILRKHQLPKELPAGSVRSIVGAGDNVFLMSGPEVVSVGRAVPRLVRDDSPAGLVTLAADANGGLWAAGRWGIYRRTDGGYSEFVHDIVSADPAFTALCFDEHGWLWTATRSGDVYRYDGELWLRMGEAEEVFGVGEAVEKLCARRGAIWAAAPVGVARFDGGSWDVIAADSLGGEVRDLAVRPGDEATVVAVTASRMWRYRDGHGDWRPLAVVDGTLATADSDSLAAFVVPPSRAINRIAFDDDGGVYLGTDDGLALIGKGGERWIEPEEGLGGTSIIDLFVDGGEVLWIGFRADGLTRIPLRSLW
jgi:ligand-binding sensor domain-containing protein